MEPTEQPSLWDLIDGVVVINLDYRHDRWAQFQQAVRGVVPLGKLHRLSACAGRDIPGFGERPWFRGRKRDGTWAGRAGVTLSHRWALEQARSAGWRSLLVLEDDVVFASEFLVLADSLAAALREQEWQVCYLGFTDPWPPYRKLAALDERYALYQVHGCKTTHAYLIKQEARDWILSQLPDEAGIWPWLARHRAIDRWYRRELGLRFPVACVSPSVVNQTAGYSDIVCRETDDPSADGHLRAVPSSSRDFGYSTGRLLRWIIVRLELVGDVVRGWLRRVRGF